MIYRALGSWMPRLREFCSTTQQQVSVRGQSELHGPMFLGKGPGKECGARAVGYKSHSELLSTLPLTENC